MVTWLEQAKREARARLFARFDSLKAALLPVQIGQKTQQNQEPLTLALSRRERELTEVFNRSTPT